MQAHRLKEAASEDGVPQPLRRRKILFLGDGMVSWCNVQQKRGGAGYEKLPFMCEKRTCMRAHTHTHTHTLLSTSKNNFLERYRRNKDMAAGSGCDAKCVYFGFIFCLSM